MSIFAGQLHMPLAVHVKIGDATGQPAQVQLGNEYHDDHQTAMIV